MKKLGIFVFIIIILSSLAYSDQKDYFNTRSVFYAASGILKFLQITNLKPKDIADSVNFQETATNDGEYYWDKISAKYSLDLEKTYFTGTNNNEIIDMIKASILKGIPVLVTYKRESVVHSAFISEMNLTMDGEVREIVVNDSGTPASDNIDANTLESNYWKLKIYCIYLVNIHREKEQN